MGASESYSLVVEMVSDGANEVQDDVEGVEQQFDDASQEVGDSAGEMEGFATKWQGAMGAVVTGLAVAAGGLLTQVPVIGGLMEGLFAVIEAVAFQMDKVLRPILQPVADAFFELAGALFELDGAAGAIVGILGAIAAVALPIAAVFGLIPAIIAAVVVGLVLLLEHFGLLGPLINVIVATLTATIGVLTTLAKVIGGAVGTAIDFLADAFGGLAKQAFNWGKDMILGFRDGILDVANAPVDAAKDVLGGIKSAISFDQRANDRMAEQWGEDMLQHFSIGIERGARTASMNIDASGGTGDGGRPASNPVVIDNRLDGEKVNDRLSRRRGGRRKSRQRDGA